MVQKKYTNGSGVAEIWANIKNYIAAQLLSFIPKSGGSVITGSSLGKTDDTGSLQVCGGSNGAGGASILLNGKNRGVLNGYVELTANDGTDSTEVQILPDGTMTKIKGASTKNFAMQEDVVPRSGGNVLAGQQYSRTVNDDSLYFYGGMGWEKGGMIAMFGKDNSTSGGSVQLIPSIPGYVHWMLLHSNGTWTWDGTACVVSSDRRIKDEIESIPDEILDAWEALEPKQYKLKSDLETDKDNAQVHYGWIAQDVESVIKDDRKAEVKNGLWLHESWDEQAEVSHEETYTEEVQTKSGETKTVTKTRKVIDTPYKAKGDSYGLRYTECLVVECKYLRRCIARLTARIEELEKGNNIK